MERLITAQKVVGLKQSKKAVLQGRAKLCFVAEDADPWVANPFLALCNERGVEVVKAPSMKELAKACRVEVPTACAVILEQS
ncbi:MAG: ribosomal L7Ae/L30e/S12e/Gadd45 family protein [Bacteroidales bacterium]|nr:ribosomal L7Ae/L30e/S12e/Gadd45 family protein [Bacteroidales bacterium]